MKNSLTQINDYINKTIPYLENNSNVWLKEHPEIIHRLKTWDWEADFKEIQHRLTKLYSNIDFDDVIGTIAINWNDYEYNGVTIYIASTNEYTEWIDDNWLDYELDLTNIINRIFLEIPDWTEGLGHQTSLFQNLFLGMVELAAISLIDNDSFKKLNKKSTYLLLSAAFHDTEYGIIFNSETPEMIHEIYFPVDAAPINPKAEQLTENSYKLFGETYTITTKWIRSNQSRLGKIPEEIKLFTEVEELNFKNEYLKELPEVLFNLTKTIKLDLSFNKLENISNSIGKLINLKTINLSNNNLKKLPSLLSLLTDLNQLHLENNQLSELPKDFKAIQTLNFLNLHHNQLTTIPELPSNLTWLNLHANQLKELPDSFKKLKKLTTLVLSDNLFTTIPKQIFELESLESIELGGNNLKEISNEFLAMPNIKQIRIYPNPFSIEKRKELKEIFGDKLFLGRDTDEKSYMK